MMEAGRRGWREWSRAVRRQGGGRWNDGEVDGGLMRMRGQQACESEEGWRTARLKFGVGWQVSGWRMASRRRMKEGGGPANQTEEVHGGERCKWDGGFEAKAVFHIAPWVQLVRSCTSNCWWEENHGEEKQTTKRAVWGHRFNFFFTRVHLESVPTRPKLPGMHDLVSSTQV